MATVTRVLCASRMSPPLANMQPLVLYVASMRSLPQYLLVVAIPSILSLLMFYTLVAGSPGHALQEVLAVG